MKLSQLTPGTRVQISDTAPSSAAGKTGTILLVSRKRRAIWPVAVFLDDITTGARPEAGYYWIHQDELIPFNDHPEIEWLPGQFANPYSTAFMNEPTEANDRRQKEWASWLLYFLGDVRPKHYRHGRWYLAKHPWSGVYTVVTRELMDSPKDWRTNPDGFPNTSHIVPMEV